jgi:hypothetical protein
MAAGGVVAELKRAGYRGLFLAGDDTLARSVWHGGQNRDALMGIVQGEGYGDLERVLASEVLLQHDPGYPPAGWENVLGDVYARALAITGTGDRPIVLTGNQWGFMYHGDDIGSLGVHLLQAGRAAVAHLIPLLDNPDSIFYEGSQEATLGGTLGYRVKDAAAYFIGRLTGDPVPFHEALAERDAEIDRLRDSLTLA